MVHVVFDTGSVSLGDFVQTGGGYFVGMDPYQRGRGLSRQRGAGVGAILRSLWRTLLPVLKGVGSTVKQEGLATGARILSNLAEGAPLKDTLVNESQTGITNLTGKLKQRGAGYKRSRRGIARRFIAPNQSIVGKSLLPPKKRQKTDTFGLY